MQGRCCSASEPPPTLPGCAFKVSLQHWARLALHPSPLPHPCKPLAPSSAIFSIPYGFWQKLLGSFQRESLGVFTQSFSLLNWCPSLLFSHLRLPLEWGCSSCWYVSVILGGEGKVGAKPSLPPDVLPTCSPEGVCPCMEELSHACLLLPPFLLPLSRSWLLRLLTHLFDPEGSLSSSLPRQTLLSCSTLEVTLLAKFRFQGRSLRHTGQQAFPRQEVALV